MRSVWAPYSLWPTSATCMTSHRSCCSSSSGLARCSRSPSSRKSCTARPHGSTIQRASHSHMAEKTAIPSLCRCVSTTSRSPSLRRALDLAKLGQSEKLDGMSRLDAFVRGIERRRQSREPMSRQRSLTSVRSHARSAAAPSSTTRSHARVSWICFDQPVLKA